MALALADSIAGVGRDLNDQARRYLAWWCKGGYSVTLPPQEASGDYKIVIM
jgi:hypothetical protein